MGFSHRLDSFQAYRKMTSVRAFCILAIHRWNLALGRMALSRASA